MKIQIGPSDGLKASLTDERPASADGRVVMHVVEKGRPDSSFGPQDYGVLGIRTADLIKQWARVAGRTDAEVAAAQRFLSQWPDGPQLTNVEDEAEES